MHTSDLEWQQWIVQYYFMVMLCILVIIYRTLLFPHFSKGGKLQKRGKINLIGRLQLTTEKTKEEDNESIVALRVLRTQVCY